VRNFDDYTITEKKILKSELLEDLLFFTRFFFKLLQGSKFLINEHHQTICTKLTEISDYKYELLNINIPPRHSKTELAAVNFIAWSLARNPSANFLYITASDELRSETSTRIRDIVDSSEFKELFGIELKQDTKAKNLWKTNKGGGLKTATILGQITGFGAGKMVDASIEKEIREFGGCIVLDDVNKIDDAEMDNAKNSRVKRILLNTVPSRKNSTDTPIINIQQRSGFNDATTVLQTLWSKSPEKICNLIMPVLSPDNVPLWANKMPLEEIERLKTGRDTWHIFETQYMQNPSRRVGSLFDASKLNRFKLSNIEGLTTNLLLAYIDVADDGSDATVCVVTSTIGNKIYIIDVLHDTDIAPVTRPKCVAKVKKHLCQYCVIETNGLGKSFYRDFKNEIELTGLTSVRPNNNHVPKHARIIAQSGTVNEFVYFLEEEEQSDEYKTFMAEIEKYNKDESLNKGQKVDSPDALTGAIEKIRRILRI